MERSTLIIIGSMLAQTALLGGLLLIIPGVSRRGLLFGVYIGESQAVSKDARSLIRSWRLWMAGALLVSMSASAAAGYFIAPEPTIPISTFTLLTGFFITYIIAHRRASAWAVEAPKVAIASMDAPTPAQTLIPLLTVFLGIGMALASAAYIWPRYGQLPDRIPIHFNIAGEPDGWADRSIASVMILPALTAIMALMLGGTTWLVAHAKRTPRHDPTGASLRAQTRFRDVMTAMVAIISIATCAMLAVGGVSTIRVALGETAKLDVIFIILGAVIAVVTIGMVLFAALGLGQGGSRIERTSDAPLTGDIAENRHWILGIIYFNRDDPSILIEHRFGVGYTINFGNPRAVALIIMFVLLSIATSVTAIVAS